VLRVGLAFEVGPLFASLLRRPLEWKEHLPCHGRKLLELVERKNILRDER
jgi:hypothetical protein